MFLLVKRGFFVAIIVFLNVVAIQLPTFGQQSVIVIKEETSEVIVEDNDSTLIATDTLAVIEEIIPEFPKEVIADRLSCLETSIPLTYNNTVNGFINYLTVRKRSFTSTMAQREHLYFPIFEEALRRHGLPEELKYLSIVESGLNPRAVSVARAVGLWQFIGSTGKMYRLHQDTYIDERMDPYKATEAACRYLKDLRDMFNGDWELALAAYNCGPGNVRRAIRRSGNRTGFWQIYNNLPRETRSYVPMFVAVNYAMNYLDEHNISRDSLARYIPSDTILVSRYLDLETFSNQLEIPLEDLQALNPQLKKNVIPDYANNYVFRIPADKKEFFLANRISILDSAAIPGRTPVMLASDVREEGSSSSSEKSKIIHRVRYGDALGKIADRYNVSVAQLRKWNNLRGSMIHSGQRLVIWTDNRTASRVAQSTVRENQNKQAAVVQAVASKESNSEKRVYLVQPGDTLWRISQTQGVSVEQLKKLNNLRSNELKPGQKLIVG